MPADMLLPPAPAAPAAVEAPVLLPVTRRANGRAHQLTLDAAATGDAVVTVAGLPALAGLP